MPREPELVNKPYDPPRARRVSTLAMLGIVSKCARICVVTVSNASSMASCRVTKIVSPVASRWVMHRFESARPALRGAPTRAPDPHSCRLDGGLCHRFAQSEYSGIVPNE